MAELSAFANGLDGEDEGSSEIHPELLSDGGWPLAEMQTGRGIGLRTETKIFMYLLKRYLVSPDYVLLTKSSLRDTTVKKLG